METGVFTTDDIQFCAATDAGLTREGNEDRFICRPVIDDHHVLLAAIDGCGGMQGGERAASIAEDVTVSFLIRVRESYDQILSDAMTYANNFIYEERRGSGRYSNMGCVMSAVLLNTLTLEAEAVHLGDTRIYRIDGDSITRVTTDHSPVGQMVRQGILTEDQARLHPMKHMVDKIMGLQPLRDFNTGYFDRHHMKLEDGTILLICSDGLTDMLSCNEIYDIIMDGAFSDAADRLIEAANRAGGEDNITAVLLHVPATLKPQIGTQEDRAAECVCNTMVNKQDKQPDSLMEEEMDAVNSIRPNCTADTGNLVNPNGSYNSPSKGEKGLWVRLKDLFK